MFKIKQVHGILIIQMDNLLENHSNSQLLEQLQPYLKTGHHEWIVDLEPLAYMNSSGLNFLISLLTRTRSMGGELVLANISKHIKDLLLMTKLESVFVVKEDVEEALAYFTKVEEPK